MEEYYAWWIITLYSMVLYILYPLTSLYVLIVNSAQFPSYVIILIIIFIKLIMIIIIIITTMMIIILNRNNNAYHQSSIIMPIDYYYRCCSNNYCYFLKLWVEVLNSPFRKCRLIIFTNERIPFHGILSVLASQIN